MGGARSSGLGRSHAHRPIPGFRRRGPTGLAIGSRSQGVRHRTLPVERAARRRRHRQFRGADRRVRRPRSRAAFGCAGTAVWHRIDDRRPGAYHRSRHREGAQRDRQRHGSIVAQAAARLRGCPKRRAGPGMSGFLDAMARSSAQRVRQALMREPLAALERRAKQAPQSPQLRLSGRGFDVIAELKLRSPAAGVLSADNEDWRQRVAWYAHGGAAAVSVLTEPTRFDGSLQHLREACGVLDPLGVPAMRKDFLVDPYQVLEARAAGAGGVLVILRMLSPGQISELLDAAAEHRMFVLLEAFDAGDLATAGDVLAARRGQEPKEHAVLIGINSRDLASLKVVPERFDVLAPLLPAGWPAVAESGVASPADAARMQRLGYRLALIGTALMTCGDPQALLRDILAAARTPES